MATFNAIAATSKAILGILKDGCPTSEFPKAEFKLYHASDFVQPIEEGVSLYLYRVSVNETLRNVPERIASDGSRHRPPLLLDLHYLLTAWAIAPDQQQRLLGWSMRALEDSPFLPASVLNRYFGPNETFRSDEGVEVIYEPLTLQELTSVWDKLMPRYQTAATYRARMIAIDSTVKAEDAPIVRRRAFEIKNRPESK